MNLTPYFFTDISVITFILKMFFINLCTYYTVIRVTKYSKKQSIIKLIIMMIVTFSITILAGIAKYTSNYLISLILVIVGLSSLFAVLIQKSITYSMILTTLSLSINYVISFIAIMISFVPSKILNIQNDYINLMIILIIHILLLFAFFNIKRFKDGFMFLQNNLDNQFFDILILCISVCILFVSIIITNFNVIVITQSFFTLIVLSIIMFITIQKTLTMYYKHKKLIEELNETKEKLENLKEDRARLEKENIEISMKSHSIKHKQDVLENKLDKLMMNNEFADELDIKEKLDKISEEYSGDKVAVTLDKTGITEIDEMLEFQQNECIKNNIEFELQISGNIHYMTNHFVSKEELEILLADHIKDAIIAIKHSSNINRSILVRMGMIDECYSLYIYDSGIEFEIDTLVNLGTKPITTHADEDGTGMGFMNTFNTLRKNNASMIIDEFGEPSKDNYTKLIAIKFDNKNEFKIKSYRAQEIKKKGVNNNMQIDIK